MICRGCSYSRHLVGFFIEPRSGYFRPTACCTTIFTLAHMRYPPESLSLAPLTSFVIGHRTEDAANEQHYEVNAEFFKLVLGPRLKYSSAFWPKPDSTFEEAEIAMLELYCSRAQLEDGMKVRANERLLERRDLRPTLDSVLAPDQ